METISKLCFGWSWRAKRSTAREIDRVPQVTFSKWPPWERARFRSAVEPVLPTFEIPLADFARANPSFDPALLKQIRFVLDRTRSAVILLDQVGLTRRFDAKQEQPPASLQQINTGSASTYG